MFLTDLPEALAGWGLTVVEVDGWRFRGHGEMAGVDAVVCHHTAGPATGNYPSLAVVRDGRSDLPGPLAQIGLGRDGTVYLIASGVAYHAGEVKESWMDNWHTIGIEAEATGVSTWPDVQVDAYARLCRALADHYGFSVDHVLGHKEVCFPAGRKVDPNFDMDAFRERVRNATGDWFDMATEEDLTRLLENKVVEPLRESIRKFAAINAQRDKADRAELRQILADIRGEQNNDARARQVDRALKKLDQIEANTATEETP